tara:strand:+ start:164 stop:496 length:333 start_codon:yes stop_codon:yes gene_type:complete
MLKGFIKYLTDISYPSKEQSQKERWDIKGRVLKSNQLFKFDIRSLVQSGDRLEKTGFFNTKANKTVFETQNQWIIFDTEELNSYLKLNNIIDVPLQELLKNLNWNQIINK